MLTGETSHTSTALSRLSPPARRARRVRNESPTVHHRPHVLSSRQLPAAVAPLDRPRSSWGVLRHRAFCLYFVGSLASNLGTWVQNTAQVLLMYQLTRSVFAVGLVITAQFGGSLLLGPWAAVIASRYGGKKMLIATQVGSGLVAAALAGLQAAGRLGAPALIIGAMALGLAFTFSLPVQTAMVPRLARDTEAAMAMNSVSYNAGRALAPLLCVAVIIFTGFTWAFALNAISFGVFAAMLVLVIPGPAAVKAPPSARARDGLVAALRQPRIMLTLAMVAAVTFADDPILILGPALARQLDASSNWAGFFLSALGFGTILGSLRIGARRRASSNTAQADTSARSRRAARSLLALVACVFLFALGISTWLSLLAAFGAGVAALRTGAVTQTQLVRQRPDHIASVMALWAIAWAGMKPLASFLDGSVASSHGLLAAVAAVSVLAVILGISEIFLPRQLREPIRGRAKRWAETREPRYQAAAAASTPLRAGHKMPRAIVTIAPSGK
jgi:predicted MFS family arabinose efflux permease